MRVNHLLSAILRGPFALQHETALAYLPLVAGLLNGEAPAIPPETPKAKRLQIAQLQPQGATTVAGRQKVRGYDEAPTGSVAVHRLQGVMMKQDQSGLCTDVPGTASLGRALLAADAHENVVAHVLDIDSGGGAVDGTAEFGAILKSLSKPVVAYSDGMIASAAYWAASACARIVLNNDTCAVGSIGVMCTVADYQGQLEAKGVKFHKLRADASDEKNEDFYQLLQGNYEPYVKGVLNPLRDKFAATVQANRPQLATPDGEKLLHGAMYFADAAVANGLADEIGTFSRAVALALELAESQDDTPAGQASGNSASTSPQPPTMFGKNKFPAVAALAGLSGVALTAALVTAANDELEAQGVTGAALITQEAHQGLTASQASLTAMTETLAAAGATDMAALVAERDKYKLEAETYGSQRGTMGTTATKTGTDVAEEGGDENDKIVADLHEKMLRGE